MLFDTVVNELVNKTRETLRNAGYNGCILGFESPVSHNKETLEITTFQGFFHAKNQHFFTNVFCALQGRFVGQVVNKTIKIGQWIYSNNPFAIFV